ncbi:MAG: DUF1295 domain-containing protein [Rhodoferax sp.]|nr:DUF1295 domain-containing protein [Rhodoferax sp.]
MKAALLAVAGLLWIIWVVALLRFRGRPELKVGTAREFVYPLAAALIVLLWAGLGASPLQDFLSLYLQAGLMGWALVTAVWLISLAQRDCGIMDVAYPLTAGWPSVVLLAWRGTWSPHEIMVALLVLVWSLRMSIHIGVRNAAHAGEDGRYAAWRRRFGGHWWWWSFFQVFTMQAVTVWLWSLVLVMAVAAGPSDLSWPHALAGALFVLGFGFQAISDLQLERFKKTRTDRHQVLDTGLWRLSRHPNYFGEAMVWCSFGALALVHPWGWLSLICPAYVTWFMSAGSATPMQERYLARTKPAYADYMTRVPVFFPWTKP